MIDRTEANDWIERMMDGEDIPPEVEDFIRQTSECREYQADLERAVSVLDALNIPEPPPGLADRVMDYIVERDTAESVTATIPNPQPFHSIWFDIGQACLNLLPEIHIPCILQREAVPAFVSLCVVLFGIFAGPQVQAGKDIRLMEQVSTCADWMAIQSDTISEEIYSKANGLINRVTEVFQRNDKNEILPSRDDINKTDSSYKEKTSPPLQEPSPENQTQSNTETNTLTEK